MRAAPIPNEDETHLPEDQVVIDPLSPEFLRRWDETANTNTNIYNEIFLTVPCNNVRNWKDYKVRSGIPSSSCSALIILSPSRTSRK